jgi:5-hydroxyisourate hydrolase
MSTVSTHVLDTSRGRPGAGISVRLERIGDEAAVLTTAVTDEDGRIARLGADELGEGSYRLVLDTAGYFGGLGMETFFPEITVVFSIKDSGGHYHVPLLLSPFAYSTYRGS